MEQLKQNNRVDWGEQYKIRPRRNASSKHEVIKILLVRALIEKYKGQSSWVRIYTEYPIKNKDNETKITDVYYENVKTNEIVCYEIQKTITPKWIEETTDFYKQVDRYFFTTDWQLIKENDLEDDITKLNKQIKELIL